MQMKIALACLVVLSGNAFGNTYYIRVDGGTAAQCDGTADAAVNSTKHCAWAHPFIALPPNIDGNDVKNVPLIHGGDTLIIDPGQYQMGLPYGAGIYDSCKTAWPYDCHTQPAPSGTPGQP